MEKIVLFLSDRWCRVVKFFATIFFAFFIMFSVKRVAHYSSESKILKLGDISPDKIIFAFDLHNVVIKPEIGAMLQKSFSNLKMQSLLILFFNPIFWYRIVKYGSVPENLINKLDHKYSKYGLTKNFLIELLNTFYPNPGMIDLIKLLKQRGYKVYLASNIWHDLFVDLSKKMPQLTNLFDGEFISDNAGTLKPNPIYYDKFKEYLDGQMGNLGKTIIFIDNEKENLSPAKKEGFLTFHFKTVNDLKEKLKTLGFNFIK